MEGYVYMIQNIKNNKLYIGSTVNYKKRVGAHLRGLRGGYHDNRLLSDDFKHFGEENFKFRVLCETESTEERFEIEESIIRALKTYENGYNLTVDGRGKYIISEETREKMRKNTLGKNNPFYGKKHNEETRRRLSEIASKNTGEKNPFYGKKHKQETIERILETKRKKVENGWVNPLKGKPKTKEAVYNNMLAQPTRKKVYAEGLCYFSISYCAKSLDISATTVRNRANSDKFPDYYFI